MSPPFSLFLTYQDGPGIAEPLTRKPWMTTAGSPEPNAPKGRAVSVVQMSNGTNPNPSAKCLGSARKPNKDCPASRFWPSQPSEISFARSGAILSSASGRSFSARLSNGILPSPYIVGTSFSRRLLQRNAVGFQPFLFDCRQCRRLAGGPALTESRGRVDGYLTKKYVGSFHM